MCGMVRQQVMYEALKLQALKVITLWFPITTHFGLQT